MDPIDLNNWVFEFHHDSEFDKLLGRDAPPERFEFATPLNLLEYLATEGGGNVSRFQSAIQDRLSSDQAASVWKKTRTFRSKLPHFSKYRERQYDRYHSAARAVAGGTATSKQERIVKGLRDEVNSSNVVLPVGQVVLHGRADKDLTDLQPYPCFISTSLDPIVALNHTRKGSGNGGRPAVYIITAGIEVPAIWGQAGFTFEWELLLPNNLFLERTSETRKGELDVIEATIRARA